VPAPALELIRSNDPKVDDLIAPMMESPEARRAWLPRMAAHGTPTLRVYLRTFLEFTLEDLVPDIECPTLVTEGEGDFAGGQSETAVRPAHLPEDVPGVHRGRGNEWTYGRTRLAGVGRLRLRLAGRDAGGLRYNEGHPEGTFNTSTGLVVTQFVRAKGGWPHVTDRRASNSAR
jgi:hypothetical protein